MKSLFVFVLFACLSTFAIGYHALSAVAAEEAPAAGEEVEEKIDYKTLENPQPNTRKSIARGKLMYTRHCTACHGPDGKAEIDLIADATDLTWPKLWYSGTSEGEIFRSVKEGAGVAMPPFKVDIPRDDDIWHLVNYIQSLWPASLRPEIEEEPEAESDDE